MTPEDQALAKKSNAELYRLARSTYKQGVHGVASISQIVECYWQAEAVLVEAITQELTRTKMTHMDFGGKICRLVPRTN